MTKPAEKVGGVILAAGEAKRFGTQKLLAPLEGRPLVQHVVEAALASSLVEIVLVVGAEADAVAKVAAGRVRVVRNDDYSLGQASSLQAGLRAFPPEIDAAVVLLGDVPNITPALIDTFIATRRRTGTLIVISRWKGRRSPPALLHRDVWPEAFALRGDVGMRDVFSARDDIAEVEVTGRLGSLEDVDVPGDFSGW